MGSGRTRRTVVLVLVLVAGGLLWTTRGAAYPSEQDANVFLNELHRRAVRAVNAAEAEIDWCELDDDPVTCADGLANLADAAVSSGLPGMAPTVQCSEKRSRGRLFVVLGVGNRSVVRAMRKDSGSDYGMTIDNVRYWGPSAPGGLSGLTCPADYE